MFRRVILMELDGLWDKTVHRIGMFIMLLAYCKKSNNHLISTAINFDRCSKTIFFPLSFNLYKQQLHFCIRVFDNLDPFISV